MKKLFFKGCLLSLALLISVVVSYADVPKKINLQGKYTKSYGDPAANENIEVHYQFKDKNGWGSVKIKPTKTDSEGLYNLNLDVDLSSTTEKFRVAIGSDPTDAGYDLASSPYAFYSSTATYALALDKNGEKLVSSNFTPNTEYKIIASSAVRMSLGTTSETAVWGKTGAAYDEQGWIDMATVNTAQDAINVSTKTAEGKNIGAVWKITGIGEDDKRVQGWDLLSLNELETVNIDTANLSDGQYLMYSTSPKNGWVNRYPNFVSNISHPKDEKNNDIMNKILVEKPGQKPGEITISDVDYAKEAGGLKVSAETYTEGTKYVWSMTGKDKQGWVELTNDASNALYIPNNADLAEIYKSAEDLQPGDVVSIDTTKDDSIVKTRTAEDTLVAGVISTEPGLLLNSTEKGYKLALVGKVPTKVCNEGGEIKRGDLLVSASIAGYAKKAGDNPKAGTVIGKALENFSSKRGTILVLVNLQ